MVVALRSGRELEEKRKEKKDTEEEQYADIGEHFKHHSPKTTKEEEAVKMQPEKNVEKEIQGKRKRLRLMNLKFHSPKGCRRQGLKRNSLDS